MPLNTSGTLLRSNIDISDINYSRPRSHDSFCPYLPVISVFFVCVCVGVLSFLSRLVCDEPIILSQRRCGTNNTYIWLLKCDGVVLFHLFLIDCLGSSNSCGTP